MMSDTILLSDLEIKVKKEIKVTKSLIRKTLNWGADKDYNGQRQTLDYCLEVSSNLTWLTHLEMVLMLYTNFEQEPAKRIDQLKNTQRIAVPRIGTKNKVHDPLFSLTTYKKEIYDMNKQMQLFLPIMNVHTHPSSSCIPSDDDLINARERYVNTIKINGMKLSIKNPEINVINCSTGDLSADKLSRSSQFFYQFTGNYKALNSLLERYHKILDDLDVSSKYFKDARADFIEQEEESLKKVHCLFAKELAKSRAFKTLYFPEGTLLEAVTLDGASAHVITKYNEKKIADNFHYKITVERAS